MNMRSLESRFAGAMLSLPKGVIKALLDSMPAGAQRQGLDPRCEFMLRGIELSGRPAPHQMSVAEARAVAGVKAGHGKDRQRRFDGLVLV